MIDIYYPYYHAQAKWEELRFSIRSLEKHLKEDFSVCIVGDLPQWIKDVRHIPYKRKDIGAESGLYNTLRQMGKYLTHPDTPKEGEFIRMHDDTYLLSDVTLSRMKVTRIIRQAQEVKSITSGGWLWRSQVMATYYELLEQGYAGYMTESHCPEVFDREAMRIVYDMFRLPQCLLLPSTLYYNVFPWAEEIIDKKTERALFYNEENPYSFLSENIEAKCYGKLYLNHNDEGLNGALKEFIEQKYPQKSRFEL